MAEQVQWHGDTHSDVPSRGYTAEKTDYLKRLRRHEASAAIARLVRS